MSKKRSKKAKKPTRSARAKRGSKKRSSSAKRISHKKIGVKRASAGKRAGKKARIRKSKKFAAPSKGARGKVARDKYVVKVEALMKLGHERGYVTYDEILREFPTIEDNMLLLEEIYERCSMAGMLVWGGGEMVEDNSATVFLKKKKQVWLIFFLAFLR